MKNAAWVLLTAFLLAGCSHAFSPDSKVTLKGPKAEFSNRF